MSTAEELTAAFAATSPPAWLHTWSVKVHKRRANFIRAEARAGGAVVFMVPSGVKPESFAKHATDMLTGLQPKVARQEQRRDASLRELKGGENFPLFGRPYRLKLVHDGPAVELRRCQLGQKRPGQVNGSMGSDLFVCVRRDAATARNIIDWYTAKGSEYAHDFMTEMARRAGITAPALSIRSDRGVSGRWGHYAVGAHEIRLHWTLFQLPRSLVEYVIAHEVAHATRPGDVHGPRWRAALARLMPDWERREDALSKIEKEGGYWEGQLTPEGEAAAKRYRIAAQFAGKFCADTICQEPPQPLEPTDANLARVFAGCAKPAPAELYPEIRSAIAHMIENTPAPGEETDPWTELARMVTS